MSRSVVTKYRDRAKDFAQWPRHGIVDMYKKCEHDGPCDCTTIPVVSFAARNRYKVPRCTCGRCAGWRPNFMGSGGRKIPSYSQLLRTRAKRQTNRLVQEFLR